MIQQLTQLIGLRIQLGVGASDAVKLRPTRDVVCLESVDVDENGGEKFWTDRLRDRFERFFFSREILGPELSFGSDCVDPPGPPSPRPGCSMRDL